MSSPTPSNPASSNPTSSGYQRPGFDVARHGAKADRSPDRVGIDRETDFDAPVPPEVRRSARLIQISLGVLLLIGLGTVAAFGGFERAGIVHGLPTIKPNETFAAGIWDVTVEGATAGQSLRDHDADDDNFLIEVDVTIANHYTRSSYISKVVTLEGMDGLLSEDPDRILYLRDNRLASQLQPELPERIAYIWQVKAGTAVPKELKVVLHSDQPKVASFQVVNEIIMYHDPAATVLVPVTDRTRA